MQICYELGAFIINNSKIFFWLFTHFQYTGCMEILHNIPINPARYQKWHIEKDFEADIFTYLRKRLYFCYHIQDIWLGRRLLDGIIIPPSGPIFLIEFKKTDGYTFNMGQFELSQIELLEIMTKNKAPAWIMIYSQKTQTYITTTYEYLKSQANSVWWIKLFAPWINTSSWPT